jgi:hypothetical protein
MPAAMPCRAPKYVPVAIIETLTLFAQRSAQLPRCLLEKRILAFYFAKDVNVTIPVRP